MVTANGATRLQEPARAGAATTEFQLVAVDLVDRSPFQPRRVFDPASLQDLTESVRAHGVLQPIRVRRSGDRFQLISGERRWLAARQAGLERIPAVVADADDPRAMVEALVENIHREDLNAVDRALALKRLRSTLGLRSWEEVGRYIGISRVHVHRLLNVTQLPAVMQEDIRSGDLTEKHARALNRLRGDPELQQRLWDRIQAEGLSGEESLAVAAELLPSSRSDRCARPPRVVSTPDDLRSLADALLTAVLAAEPADLERARPELHDLCRWLVELFHARPRRDRVGA